MNILLFRNFRDFMSLSKEVTKALKNTGYLPDINGEASTTASSAETSNPEAEDSNESPEEPIIEGIEEDPQPGPSGISTAAASGSSSTRYYIHYQDKYLYLLPLYEAKLHQNTGGVGGAGASLLVRLGRFSYPLGTKYANYQQFPIKLSFNKHSQTLTKLFYVIWA